MRIIFVETPCSWLVRQHVQIPLGILYLATILNKKGYNVRVFRPENIGEMKNVLDYDVYCFSGTTLEISSILKCAEIVKEKNPKSIIFLGGTHITAIKEEQPYIDSICIGEGELVILKMIEDLEKGKLQRVYNGIKADINKIPIVDRNLIEGEHGGNVFTGGKNYIGTGSENFITSRGCVYDCSFCASHNLWGNNVGYRSLDSIEGELISIINVNDGYIRQLRICDDNFTLNKKRLAAICILLKAYGFIWRCSARADSLDEETCKMMYDCGCREISPGIESGDIRVLKGLNKKTCPDLMLKGCKAAHEAGITVRALFMIGTPFEREDTPERNIEFINKLSFTAITLSTFIPLPGTSIWYNPEDYNCRIITRDFNLYNKDYYVNKGGEKRKREYIPLIHNKFLTIEQMVNNVDRMEKFIDKMKVNKG